MSPAALAKAICGCLLVLGLPLRMDAICVRIAPIALVGLDRREAPASFRPEKDLGRALGALPLSGSVEFALAEGAAAPFSFLDAARLCELAGYPYLVYGYIQKRESVYSSELKLLSRDGKRVEASFVSSDDEAHYGRLVEDLAGKIADYFLLELAIPPGTPPPEPRRNIFEVPLAIGIWAPAGRWAESLTGLFDAELGLRLIPRKPLGGLRSRPFYLAIGLLGEYSVGKSGPGLEGAYLHRISASLPIELFLGLGGASSIELAAGPLAEFDLLVQGRRYAGEYREATSAGGAMAAVGYRYVLSDRFALGLGMEVDTVFYEKPLVSISPRLRLECSLAEGRGDRAE